MRSVYLDSSSVVKQYVQERGSIVVDEAYDAAEAGVLKLSFSLWNVGEVLGAFDKYFTRGSLSKKELRAMISDFISETLKLSRLGVLLVHPLTAAVFVSAWLLLLRRHLYEADALQIATAEKAGCDLLLSSDTGLVDIARAEGLTAFNVETEAKEARARLVGSGSS